MAKRPKITLNTSVKVRRKLGIGDIALNAAVCRKCKDGIASAHRHDYQECRCGAIAVDGGSWYLRRAGKPKDIMELSVMFNHQPKKRKRD